MSYFGHLCCISQMVGGSFPVGFAWMCFLFYYVFCVHLLFFVVRFAALFRLTLRSHRRRSRCRTGCCGSRSCTIGSSYGHHIVVVLNGNVGNSTFVIFSSSSLAPAAWLNVGNSLDLSHQQMHINSVPNSKHSVFSVSCIDSDVY